VWRYEILFLRREKLMKNFFNISSEEYLIFQIKKENIDDLKQVYQKNLEIVIFQGINLRALLKTLR
jgi:hypothetical protein